MKVLEASEYDVMKLLTEAQSAYRVPLYQRPYAWSEDQWADLYDDISGLDSDESHFLGSFVIVDDSKKKRGVNYYQIVDGQQRFATILIWLSAIRDIALKENPPLANQIDNKYLFVSWIENGAEVKIPKIQLGDLDKEAFSRVLNNKKKDGDHLIYDCYNFFKERTSLDDFYLLSDNVNLVRINTADHLNAFRLFETMNDRGLELSAADLIKNYILMKVAGNKNVFRELIEEWNDMYEKVRDIEPVKFIRRYFLSSYKGKVTESKLYDEIKNRFDDKKGKEILAFVKDLNDKASIYKKIYEANFANDKIDQKLKQLHLVEVSTSYTLLLKIATLFEEGITDERIIDEKKFIEIMELIENFHIRWGVIGLHTSRLDQIYNDICNDISELNSEEIIDHIKQVFTLDIKREADDETFKRKLMSRPISANAKRTKYILWRLSNPTGETIPNIINLETEHIMPQRLSNRWVEYLKEKTSLNKDEINAEKNDKKNLIGNLTIIKGEWNQRMSNRPFEEKKESYKLSEFTLNQELLNYDEWNFETIDQRTEELANLALKIWPWNYKYTSGTEYWITTLKDKGKFTAEERLNELLVNRGVYAFGDDTPGKNQIKPGDRICMYMTQRGIAAVATVESFPENNPKKLIPGFEEYPWLFKIKDVKIYTESPLKVDKEFEEKLDYFKEHPKSNIGFFLQSAHKINKNDFEMLTQRNSEKERSLYDY